MNVGVNVLFFERKMNGSERRGCGGVENFGIWMFCKKMLGGVSLFCGLIRYIDVTVAESESFGCTEGWS